MTTKYVPPPMKTKIPEEIKTSTTSIVTKFLPIICAGAAVGVSILALKELKKIKAEMVLVKNQQQNNVVKTDPVLSKKMEQLDEQLKRVNLYLAQKNSPRTDSKIIKNILKTELPKEVTIINNDNDVEYEEVEVTDDEEDNEEN